MRNAGKISDKKIVSWTPSVIYNIYVCFLDYDGFISAISSATSNKQRIHRHETVEKNSISSLYLEVLRLSELTDNGKNGIILHHTSSVTMTYDCTSSCPSNACKVVYFVIKNIFKVFH